MQNKRNFLVIIMALFTISVSYAGGENYAYNYLYENLPFKMPKIQKPVFPACSVKLTEYGGVPDGVTLNTDAFANAINALSKKGGGTLIVSSGVWYTGPIVFQSNIHLHLERGALILFTTDRDAYPVIETNFEGKSTRKAQSPISGRKLENIAITGEGVISGSGEVWRKIKKIKVPDDHWKKTVNSGGVLKNPGYWAPSESAEFMRPVMISFIECKNLLLQGVLFENSPAWNIHPLMCENVIIDGIFVRNPSYAQNGDGLDIESCKNVIVVNTTLDVGDDAICLKSGKDEQGRKRGMPTENVIVNNCKVFKGHGGFVVGSEM
jgi:polygalacturonase